MPTTSLLATQPESYGQLLKRSLRLYGAGFSHVIILAFLLSIVVFIPRFLSDLISQDLFLNLPFFSPYRLWLFAINLASMLFAIAILWRLHCILHNLHEPLAQDVKMGLKKLFAVFIATLIQGFIIYVGILLIYSIIFWLHHQQLLFMHTDIGRVFTLIIFLGQFFLIAYVTSLFIFLIPLIAIETKGVFSALKRSAYLAWNHWWRVFTLQITPWIIYIAILILLRFLFKINLHIYFLEHIPHTLWTTLFNLVLFAIFIPWILAILIVQLKDLELRKKIKSKL